MAKNITPLDDKFVAPEALPDRSSLSKAYKQQSKTNMSFKTPKNIETGQNGISIRDGLILNTLIMIPYIVSYLSVRAIYSMNYISISAPQSRLNMMLLTTLMLIAWYVALKLIRKCLSQHLISSAYIVTFYSFFIFPVIAVSVESIGNGVSDIMILSVTFILSQIYIWALVHLLRKGKISASTLTAPLAIVLVVICLAIFLR